MSQQGWLTLFSLPFRLPAFSRKPAFQTANPRLLRQYDEQLRTEAEVARADWWDQSGPLFRAVFDDFALITYRDLGGLVGNRLTTVIEETVDFFARNHNLDALEWKTRAHDAPANLPSLLESCGFEAEETETVMVGVSARLAKPVEIPAGVVIRRAGDGGDLAGDVARSVELTNRVFGVEGHTPAMLLRQLQRDPEDVQLWLAEIDGEVITSGRLEIVPNTDFAGLWGGATAPEWRGRGIYRALTAARARVAVARGIRYLHSDCTEMSRPIMERSGLTPITTTTPYVFRYE